LAAQTNAAMQLEVQDLRSIRLRLEEELLENGTGLQAARDREMDLSKDVVSLRKQIEELRSSRADAVSDDREKRKAEMLSEMMAKIETVSPLCALRLTDSTND
jgi:hypothetical protein